MNVAVLLGGWSAERAVSLTSGAACAAALRRLGHDVTEIDMDSEVALRLYERRPDVVFNALHGTPGEDGTAQGLMDLMGIRYTHSGLRASAVAIDKQLTKAVLVPLGIPMPAGVIVDDIHTLFDVDPLPRPYVLKPVDEGSSVGVVIIDDSWEQPINQGRHGPWDVYRTLLAEPYIRGRELTVAVLGDEPLAVTELVPKAGFYDYNAKYQDGLTEHRCPAPIPDDVRDAALAMALKAHRALGCRGVTRSDFRWDDEQPGAAGLFLLEVNTQPGMTPLSLVPEQAAYCGIVFDALVQRILDLALEPTA